MATASMKTVSSYTVNLELTQDECETLRILFGAVGGMSATTRRKHILSIDSALQFVGVREIDFIKENHYTGEIYFK